MSRLSAHDSPGVLAAGWRGDLIALVAGALLPLAFAPYHLFPVAVLSPALLFAVLLTLTPAQGFRRGWLFGLGMFGVGVSWIFVSIHEFGSASVPLAVLLTLLFVSFMALYPALLGFIAAYTVNWWRSTKGAVPVVELLVVLPALWTLFEWWRGWFLSGFPWLNLGVSQIGTPLAGLAPLLGEYGVSWAAAFSAGLVVLAVFRSGSRWRYLVVLFALWAGAALAGQIEWTQPKGKPLKVALLQGNVPQEIKWLPEQLRPNLELYTGLTAQHWDSDLIVWPETAVTAFYYQLRDGFISHLQRAAQEHNTDLLVGLPITDQDTGRYYNAMMSLGSSQGFYRKYHLVPFGDFVPFEEQLRGLIAFFDLPMSSFSPGSPDQPLLEAAGHKIGISICYEDAFGAEVIRTLPEADLLVNVSNDAWWGDSFGPHQHLQIASMRALEGGRPLVRATNTGITAIIDYRGRITSTAPQFEVAALTGVIQPRQGATPYVRWGNLPIVVLMAGMLGMIFLRRVG